MMLALASRVQVLARRGARAASSVLTMPALSPTMTSGKIARWTVKEGDKLSSGQVIGEVETDKATIDFVFQDDGYLAKLLVTAGAEDVAVGAPVCVVVDEKSEIAAAQAAPAPKAAVAPVAAPAAASAPAAAAAPPVVAAPAAPKPVEAVAAPKPAAALPVSPKPPAAAPAAAKAAAPAPAADAPYLAFVNWGQNLARSPLGASLGKQQRDYTVLFGYTGHDAPEAPAEKAPKAPKA